ncbi:MAG: hypothetical protein R3B06_23765 [Kofleriaceae bacterium]
MSRTLRTLGLATAILAGRAAAARAQHCHVDTPEPAATSTDPPRHVVAVTVATRWIAGVGEVPNLTGSTMPLTRSYQGADLIVGAAWQRVNATVGLGAYRVEAAGVGLDDLRGAVAVRVTPAAAPVAVRVVAGATLPTGDADVGRGMGHVMAAGGAALGVGLGRLHLDGSVVYARALGDGAAHAAHAHGAELWPLIDPMNAEEVTADLAAAARPGPAWLAALASAQLGEPLGHGQRRVVLGGGVEVTRGRYRAVASIAAPVVGTPYHARGQLELAYHY